jgi:hypothetical protein
MESIERERVRQNPVRQELRLELGIGLGEGLELGWELQLTNPNSYLNPIPNPNLNPKRQAASSSGEINPQTLTLDLEKALKDFSWESSSSNNVPEEGSTETRTPDSSRGVYGNRDGRSNMKNNLTRVSFAQEEKSKPQSHRLV